MARSAKSAQRATLHGDARWATLARSPNELTIVLDPDGHPLYIDPAVRWALGYSPAELRNLLGPNLVHPDDVGLADRAWREMLDRPGEEVKAEYRLRTADSSWRWFEISTTRLAPNSADDAVAVRYRDVSAQHEASAARVAEQERFRALVQHSYDAIVVSDENNVMTYVTPAIKRMFGYEPGELLGKSGFDFVHPDDVAEAVEHAQALVVQAGNKMLITFRLRAKDGDWRWCECTSVNLLDHPYVHGIINSFRDVHDRKRAEDELRQSEERLSALLQNADGAVMVADTAGRLLWAGPSSAALWGFPPEDMVGRSMVDHIHPEDRREVVRQYSKMTSAPGLSVRTEARIQHTDGSWRWYEAVFTNCLDQPAVKGIVANVRDVTERVVVEQALRESESRLEHQATHDELTDLPNRTLLFDRMEVGLARARRNGTRIAVLYLDIDNFKVINDSQGPIFGDELLLRVATRLRHSVRAGDTVARLGGDEFIVLAEDLEDEQDALALANNVTEALTQPFSIGDSEVFVTSSLGVSFSGGDGVTPADLVRDADSAMYQAKANGRDRTEVFDDGMRARAVERHQLETALRRAVSRRQLQVHYQPIIDLASGRAAGVEALVRWKHPARGMLYPNTFISIAEETGLIVPLGAWIFDTACSQVARWRDVDPRYAPPFVCVNFSARQLAEPALTDDIANVLAATRIDPSSVHLEITESVLMGDVGASQDLLDRLKVLGVRVAVDDFGTGYSSFSYLTRFPVDVLKIDQSFVQQIDDDREPNGSAIVAAIIGLGHTLGLRVVAEGVETAAQLAELRRLGCDLAQGYLFSGAVPGRKLHDLLHAAPTW
ncbi:MAG: EAL domain-containing protein [Actinobacteria bacterium]|nr:EAL domain-containing protein [Actinomycetota bacterium]